MWLPRVREGVGAGGTWTRLQKGNTRGRCRGGNVLNLDFINVYSLVVISDPSFERH